MQWIESIEPILRHLAMDEPACSIITSNHQTCQQSADYPIVHHQRERIRKLGWNESKEFFAFGNGIVQDGEFHEVDDMGIITDNQNNAYYIPATSKIYRDNTEIFQFERLMVHTNKSGALLYDYVERLTTVFGNNVRVAFGYLLATLFRDIVYRKTRHFRILNLFGEKGTGKTTLATSLEAFFLHDVEPSNMGVASVPAMNDRVSQAVNILVVFDEYKNDLDIRKIAFLKELWGSGGQTKKNTQTDGMATQTIVTTGVVICGQEKPTQTWRSIPVCCFWNIPRPVSAYWKRSTTKSCKPSAI